MIRPLISKLTLTAYREKRGVLSRIPGRFPFSVMLNPEYVSIESGIKYTTVDADQNQDQQKFASYEITKVEIPKIILDATGAVPKAEWPDRCESIKDMIFLLQGAVCDLDDESHQPPIVELCWGPIYLFVRMTKCTTKYVLFNSKGTPLRAEVTLTLESYESENDSSKKKSPDLTHLVEVKAGDTLPLMCDRIYNDSSYYLQIARINGLTNFRQIKPGTMLEFPPMR